MSNTSGIKKLCLQVNQRFGSFYVVTFTADELLQFAYSDPLVKEIDRYSGTQRLLNEKRRVEIRKYIESSECAFPNSIILAANFLRSGTGQVEEDDSIRWKIDLKDDNYYLTIPNPKEKMAIIIDGQHRVFGFEDANSDSREIDLVCSVYLDLPSSLQAFLFATINSTQKRVDKSLAYELFGFDIVKEDPVTWSPDKLAISLCRKLNQENNSPFHKHVKPGAIVEVAPEETTNWRVSTACIVDCILRLISTNPKEDKSILYKAGKEKKDYQERIILEGERARDRSPLRELYLNCHDGVIYNIICNFFNAAFEIFKPSNDHNKSLIKTIGIQGLFDVLREYILSEKKKFSTLKEVDFTENKFILLLTPCKKINFSNDFFLKFSGVGRARVRDVILVTIDIKKIEQIVNPDLQKFLSDLP